MSKEVVQKKKSVLKPQSAKQTEPSLSGPQPDAGAIQSLQRRIGNRAVQRLLAQRSGDGAFELEEETAGRIDQQRGGGHALDGAVQQQMGSAMGYDFSDVRVHTGSQANELNQQLSAKAFTAGRDVFFREGAYDPGSTGGKELIAHELTHVVQQGAGQVSGGQKMTVNPPGDVFEQEADSVAQQVARAGSDPASGAVSQRQEEEEMALKRMQRQEVPEEEMALKRIQRQEELPEEEMALKRIQRQEELPEEEMALKRIQRQEELPEEEMALKRIQRQDELPEEEL